MNILIQVGIHSTNIIIYQKQCYTIDAHICHAHCNN